MHARAQCWRKNDKLEFRATDVVDDPARFHLSGRVNFAFKGYCLFAGSLELDRAQSILTVKGNVELSEPNGNIIRAERLTLSDEFRDAFRDAIAIPHVRSRYTTPPSFNLAISAAFNPSNSRSTSSVSSPSNGGALGAVVSWLAIRTGFATTGNGPASK